MHAVRARHDAGAGHRRRWPARAAEPWSGRAILEAIDALATDAGALDPAAAARPRAAGAAATSSRPSAGSGARLAEALAHAHGQGVLHRDIKPANILLNRYGRPLLADFNLAIDPAGRGGGMDRSFGGTLAYMAPEHLDAFNPDEPTPPDAVDARSDLYSLGVVLFELLTGERPFAVPPRACPGQGPAGDGGRAAAARPRRRDGGGPTCPRCSTGWSAAAWTPTRASRYPTAADLARVLEGCRELYGLNRPCPTPAR